MGLSGRKVKQRIGHDPRNLTWADDAAKFGQAYLSKFGWDSTQGLGTSGEGRTSALKVSQKLDMLGIGMQHQNSPDGLAWRQNRDFENLLKRLNDGTTGVDESIPSGFHRAGADGEEQGAGEVAADGGDQDAKKAHKRSAVEDAEAGLDDRERKRRKKEEKVKRKEEKAKRKEEERRNDAAASSAVESQSQLSSSATDSPATSGVSTPVSGPSRSHRARHIRMKRMAASTPAAMSEILGIASSSIPSTPAGVFSPTPELTSSATPELTLEKLTTSTHSVADYFKAKLAAKAQVKSADVDVRTSSALADDRDEDAPQGGIGMASRTRGDDAQTNGLGFGTSKFAAMFAPAAATPGPELGSGDARDTVVPASEDTVSKEERKRAREDRKKDKAERKQLRAARKAAESASAAEAESPPLISEPRDGGSVERSRRSKKDKR